MESFDIRVEHNGATHLLTVHCDGEDPEYLIFRDQEPVGTVKPDTDHDLYWISEDIMDAEFVEKIGDRIERQHR
ncbi:MAG: hypothetical protein EOO89_29040 [Pedobacter sp.]|nr:MAG: hypothetical protein EOO89_29040 [Pedobacter sp.]